MPMHTCPDCAGRGSVHTSTVAVIGEESTTWCRSCYGCGLVRLPEEDDEHDDTALLWPESIRWRRSA